MRYLLSGTAKSASITMTNGSGGIEQRTVDMPWDTTLRADRWSPVSISAQNPGSGTITCAILVEGWPFKTITSEGQHPIALCRGLVPLQRPGVSSHEGRAPSCSAKYSSSIRCTKM